MSMLQVGSTLPADPGAACHRGPIFMVATPGGQPGIEAPVRLIVAIFLMARGFSSPALLAAGWIPSQTGSACALSAEDAVRAQVSTEYRRHSPSVSGKEQSATLVA